MVFAFVLDYQPLPSVGWGPKLRVEKVGEAILLSYILRLDNGGLLTQSGNLFTFVYELL